MPKKPSPGGEKTAECPGPPIFAPWRSGPQHLGVIDVIVLFLRNYRRVLAQTTKRSKPRGLLGFRDLANGLKTSDSDPIGGNYPRVATRQLLRRRTRKLRA